jgi:hypothetical protein
MAPQASAAVGNLDRWEPAAAPSEIHAGSTATLLHDGRVLVAGGSRITPSGFVPCAPEIYDPARDTWQPAGSMQIPRDEYATAVLRDGRVLVAGGWSAVGEQASAELFDPGTNSWTAAAPMTRPRVQPQATVLPDGSVLVTSDGTAERYDPAADRWTPVEGIDYPGLGHIAELLDTGRVLLAGGRANNNGEYGHFYPRATTTQLYDPATGAVAPGTPASPGQDASALTLTDGRVLVLGVTEDSFTQPGHLESSIYDPAHDAWTPAAPPTQLGGNSAPTILPTGRALFDLAIYDPATDRWSPTAPQSIGSSPGLTSTRLADGRVLFAGVPRSPHPATAVYGAPFAALYTAGRTVNADVGDFGGIRVAGLTTLRGGRLRLVIAPLRRGTLDGELIIRARFRSGGRLVGYARADKQLTVATKPSSFTLRPDAAAVRALITQRRLKVSLTIKFFYTEERAVVLKRSVVIRPRSR